MDGMQPLSEIEMQRKEWTRLVPRSCQAQPQGGKHLPSKWSRLSERMACTCSVTLYCQRHREDLPGCLKSRTYKYA